MGGQMQQSNTAATAMYDQPSTTGGSLHNAGSSSDAGDAVMARWLQSAGLQHLASPLTTSTANDHRNMLMQVQLNFVFNILIRVIEFTFYGFHGSVILMCQGIYKVSQD